MYSIGILRLDMKYPSKPPFNPNPFFPENDIKGFDDENLVYSSVRELFYNLDLDQKNYNTSNWNPLGIIVSEGDTVIIKPNLVRDFHDTEPELLDCLITHGSIIRVVIDYVFIALKGKGRIIVADSPQNDANFNNISQFCGFSEIAKFYLDTYKFNIEFIDLRKEYVQKIDGILVERKVLTGDPLGYTAVDLGHDSEFYSINSLCHLLRGAEYNMGETYAHHNEGKNEYLICKTILNADVVINIPKLKTHKKSGVTLSLKNMVGINGDKNWLPHHREGVPSQGGDQYKESGLKQRIEQKIIKIFKRIYPKIFFAKHIIARYSKKMGTTIFGDTNNGTIRSGNWYGNDTIWRTIIDLNKILFYADKNGIMRKERQRKYFTIIDGVVSGEGNGPLAPTSINAGLLIAGFDPVIVDVATCFLMGFDYKKIPQIFHCFELQDYKLTNISNLDEVYCSYNGQPILISDLRKYSLQFKAHFGWEGHIELQGDLY